MVSIQRRVGVHSKKEWGIWVSIKKKIGFPYEEEWIPLNKKQLPYKVEVASAPKNWFRFEKKVTSTQNLAKCRKI